MRQTRSLSRSKGGSVLTEFAILAPVFFLTIMGLVEFVLYQYKAYALNFVTYEAARNLQTGEVNAAARPNATPQQARDDMAAAFREEACNKSGMMIDCNKIDYDVRAFTNIGDVTFPEAQFDEDGKPIGWDIIPGTQGQFSVVRASIEHTFITPFMGEIFREPETNKALLTSFVIVRNEPW
jgi:Flp pilus assembly protein TadG